MRSAFILSLIFAVESSRVIEPVFWNVDNALFARNYTRHVQLQEKMDIFCPQYESPADEDVRTFSQSHHFQTIFMVDESSYNSCSLPDRPKRIMTCEQPLREKKFTMIFQEVNPNPFGLVFSPDKNYYFISTSLGDDLGGISQENDGVCSSHSMKLRVTVHHGDIDGPSKIQDDPQGQMENSFYDYKAYEDVNSDSFHQNDLNEDPAKEKQSELPNAIIVGVIVGTFMVILVIVAILLTRRVFENRKSSVSYPTLSDYQSSYVEKYDFPPYNPNIGGNAGSPQTVYSQAYTPNLPQTPIVSLLPTYQSQPNQQIANKEKRLNDEFSYIDGSRLSNRTHEIVMV